MEFKVYGIDGTKCIRKFKSLEDAQSWAWTVDTGKAYRIEWTEPADETYGIRERKNVVRVS